ncbi:MAG: caspase family protein [Planctomycetaceae bacterium]
MAKLHALVVGINIYKSEKLKNYPLSGCLNDVSRMSAVLQQMFGGELQLLTLTEAEATRAGIIASFRSQLIEPARARLNLVAPRACISVSLQRSWLPESRCDSDKAQRLR